LALRESKLNWLQILPWSLEGHGGVNHVVRNLFDEMQAGGAYSPLLLISTGEPPPNEKYAPTLSAELRAPWDARRPAAALLAFFVYLPGHLYRLRRLFVRYGIRAATFHYPSLGACEVLALKKLRLTKAPVILSFYGTDARDAAKSTGLERQIWRVILRAADRIVTVSDQLRSVLTTFEPRCAGKIMTIPTAVNIRAMRAGSASGHALPEAIRDRPIILNVGRFDDDKARDVLIRAFAELRRRVPDACLVLVGGAGPNRVDCEALIAAAGLRDAVVIVERVPNGGMPAFYASARVFVLSSRREGLPLSILEAAACNAPVVSTAAGGVGEIIQDRVTGRIVPVDDYAALAAAIGDAMIEREESMHCAARLYALVEQNYSSASAYQAYLGMVTPANPAQSA